MSEYNLRVPEHLLYLEMAAAFGGFQARQQNMKSMQNRIHRAKRGLPACGRLPYGRTFDPRTEKWGVDPEKQKVMDDVARRYLAGEPMPRLAEELGVNHSSLHKTLTKRCGEVWLQKFRSDELQVNEIIETPVPPLLGGDVIQAVLAKVSANKTWSHGQLKNPYLLSRMLFCEKCGYGMFGQTHLGKYRYYRHSQQKREHSCPLRGVWVRAEKVEEAVVAHLFSTFGNPAAVERAIERAIPDLNARRDLEQRRERTEQLIEKKKSGRQRIIRQIEAGNIDDSEASDLLAQSGEQIGVLQKQLSELSAAVIHAPSVEEVKQTARAVASRFPTSS